jgi:hypothetical protein
MYVTGKPEAMGGWLPKPHGAHPMRQNPNVERAIQLALHQAMEYKHQVVKKEAVEMPKILKKFEHVRQTRSSGFEAKYDWDLILGGQSVLMEKNADYVSEGERSKDDRNGNYKKGDKFDRTDSVIGHIQVEADRRGKSATCTRVDKAGKPSTTDVHGFVVTARDMTADEIKARDARRAELAAKKAAAESNGSHADQPVAEAAVAPE